MKLRITMLLLVLALLLVACNREQTNVEIDPTAGVNITTTLSEAQVNTIISNIVAQSQDPLLREISVDLQSGVIQVNGVRDRENGDGVVNGSFTVIASVINGAILMEVTSVSIDGFDMNDARLTQLNQQLANAFTAQVNQNNRLITVRSLVISNDGFTITINARGENSEN